MAEIWISVKLSWILFHNLQKSKSFTPLGTLAFLLFYTNKKIVLHQQKGYIGKNSTEKAAPDQATRAKHYFPVSTLSLYSL